MTRELRERAKSDGKTSELYRHTTSASRNIFLVTGAKDIVYIERYNMVSNRWDISRIIRISELSNVMDFGLLLNQSKIHLIGGRNRYTPNEVMAISEPVSLMSCMDFPMK